MKSIFTAKGEEILVDDEDYELVSQYRWNIGDRGYARRNVRKDGKQIVVMMHRFILGIEPGDPVTVVHENGIGTDNRRANLKVGTRTQGFTVRRKYAATNREPLRNKRSAVWTPDEIYTSSGEIIHVSPEDWFELAQHCWQVGASGYAQRNVNLGDGRRALSLMHREILGCAPGDGVHIDHRDHDVLNNRRSNLRKATHAQNMWNKAGSKTGTSRFKGVSLSKRTGKWIAQIRCKGESKVLGYFDNEESAYAAYCEAARQLHGEFANLGDQQ